MLLTSMGIGDLKVIEESRNIRDMKFDKKLNPRRFIPEKFPVWPIRKS